MKSPRRLRVTFIATGLYVGGQERKLVDVLLGLDRGRFEPSLVLLKEKGPLAAELEGSDLPLVSGLLAHKWDLRVLPRLVAHLRRIRPHAVFTVGQGDKLFWGRLAARLAGVPVVVSSIHVTFTRPGAGSALGPLNKALTPLTDAFVAVCEAARRYLVNHEGLPADRVHVIYNGVDTGRFGSVSRTDARSELGLPPSVPVVGIVATLRPEKAHEVLIDAMVDVGRDVPDALLLVVGDGSRRSAIEEYAGRRLPDGKVRFLGRRTDIPRILAALDVFVLSSDPYVETFPNAVLEAMASRLPVVATDVGGLREMVVEGETGHLVPHRNPRALARAIARILGNPEEAARMGWAGRTRVETHFGLERMIREREELLERLILDRERSR